MSFELDPVLEADTCLVGDMPLSRLLLANDARYPWCILVPRHEELRELHELNEGQLRTLMDETTAVSRYMEESFGAHKMNVAALGNQVAQLHVHVIVRRRDDDAWPKPIWGVHPAMEYEADERARRVEGLRAALLG